MKKKMKNFVRRHALLGLVPLAFLANAAQATEILTFEGLANGQAIGNYYNGGAGGNYGITFGPDSLALIATSSGGSGNFSNNPSGKTIAYFTSGPGDVMNVLGGFTTGFSFYYAAGAAASVSVYDGLNGTGNLITTLNLAVTPTPYSVWDNIGVSFSGTAYSVVFSGSANYVGFDNITLGSAVAANDVPEPASIALIGLGLVGLGLSRRKNKQL